MAMFNSYVSLPEGIICMIMNHPKNDWWYEGMVLYHCWWLSLGYNPMGYGIWRTIRIWSFFGFMRICFYLRMFSIGILLGQASGSWGYHLDRIIFWPRESFSVTGAWWCLDGWGDPQENHHGISIPSHGIFLEWYGTAPFERKPPNLITESD